MGSAGVEFLPPLIKALEDSAAQGRLILARSPVDATSTDMDGFVEAEFRRDVIIALGEIGSGTQKAIRALIAALEDSDANVRTAAAGALGRMGLAANIAIPALLRLLGDSRHFVREIATRALARIDATDPRIILPLTEALKDSSPGVRTSAAEALGNVRPTEDIAAMLAGVLQDTSPGVRIAAAKSLSKFGVAAKVAVPALTKAMESRYDAVRKAVTAALERIGV
jgi:hypothetical protein